MSGSFGRRPIAVAATALALLLGASACSSSSSSGGSGGHGSSRLTMQFAGPPVSMNPALAGNGGSTIFSVLAYDPLIYLTGDGKVVPDLATSWHYVGTGNKVFELTLRSGATFADGAPLTAAAAVASMRYALKAGGLAQQAGAVASVDAVDAKTVRVTYSKPNPDAALTMTQFYGLGTLIGPKGLADPKSLLTSTDGVGQYTYNGKTSVANSHYDYDKNPHYFNPSAQMFSGVTVRIINDPQAVLSAARTGQVSFASGSASTADAAKSANLNVLSAPFFNWSLILADTKGAISKPLADARVRQAIGYALDRPSLAKALAGSDAAPSGQVLLPGTDGYVPDFGFDYDLSKAKNLMAQAGYADGFPLTILAQSTIDPNTTVAQAITNALKAIGIRATLHVEAAGIAQFSSDSESKKYAAVIFPCAGIDMFQLHTQISVGLFNPFGNTDPQLEATLDKAFASTGSARTSLYQQASRRYNELAWYIPVFSSQNLSYVSPKLANVTASVLDPNPMPVAPTASLAWHYK